MSSAHSCSSRVAVIGGGPAGLMAAETLAQAGFAVEVFDAMPSMGRKFLLAGVGGMNITHAEPWADFLARYRAGDERFLEQLTGFDNQALRAWIHQLGIETFVGSSGRVFPKDMKAAPLLRAWLKRLREIGVQLHTRQRWLGWDEHGCLRFQGLEAERAERFDACVLALGGGSWARLGSDGAWQSLLAARGVALSPLRPANCGFEVAGWSAHLCERFAGAPLKPLAARVAGGPALRGECVLTAQGLEGGVIYALSAVLREQIESQGQAQLWLDLLPQWEQDKIAQKLAKPRGKQSVSSFLTRQLGLDGARLALLRELAPAQAFVELTQLAKWLKSLPVTLVRTRPLDEAISSAGGVCFDELDQNLMLSKLPGVFCAGEMLDWEAPTGGYLLTACFATGRAAGLGAAAWLKAGAGEVGPR